MPKGKPNKRYTPEFKIKVVETMYPLNSSASTKTNPKVIQWSEKG